MRRFVILRHTLPLTAARASHWDLMFDTGEDGLQTWAVEETPNSPLQQPAVKLADHRRLYLDFEGPVAPDRGEVARWDEGICEVLVHEPHCVQFHLLGARMRGTASISLANGAWTYRFVASVD